MSMVMKICSISLQDFWWDAILMIWRKIDSLALARGNGDRHCHGRNGHAPYAKAGMEITEGRRFFINSGMLHEMKSCQEGPCKVRILAFHPRLVGTEENSIFWEKYVRPVLEHPEIESLRLDQDLQSARRDLIEASWLSCRNEEYGYESQVRENLTRLLLLIGDGRPQMLMENAEKYRRYNERTKQMLTFIKRHFGEELSVRDIADSASISESECLRCFRKILDTSPIAYLKTYRLQRAAELLETTSRKVSDIAAQCGFGEMSYLSKSFREIYRCTPSQYRSRT